MKCICGYHHVDTDNSWEVEQMAWKYKMSEEDVIKNNGEDKFKRLSGIFEMDIYHGRQHQNVSLYICPKCGTVRMED
jgi:acetone carboxylase gamma subunit